MDIERFKQQHVQILQIIHRMRRLATAGIVVERWGAESAVGNDPEGFRRDCNTVLKALHRRIQRENTEFYPQVEAL